MGKASSLNKLIQATWLTIALVAGIESASAFCYAPSAPDAPSSFLRPTEPTVPYCVNEFTRTHNCDDWEIDAYNSDLEMYRNDVDNYVRELKNYASEAESFLGEVIEYANCEIRNLD